jgi:hypothetical protein
MTSKFCELCDEIVIDTWSYQISDEKERYITSGHKECIDELQIRFRAIKNYSTKSVKVCLKELNIKGVDR